MKMLTCKEALSSGLFIACGAVQLTAEEEALNGFGLQRWVALVGREVVILHSISWPQHFALLQTYQHIHHCDADDKKYVVLLQLLQEDVNEPQVCSLNGMKLDNQFET